MAWHLRGAISRLRCGGLVTGATFEQHTDLQNIGCEMCLCEQQTQCGYMLHLTCGLLCVTCLLFHRTPTSWRGNQMPKARCQQSPGDHADYGLSHSADACYHMNDDWLTAYRLPSGALRFLAVNYAITSTIARTRPLATLLATACIYHALVQFCFGSSCTCRLRTLLYHVCERTLYTTCIIPSQLVGRSV